MVKLFCRLTLRYELELQIIQRDGKEIPEFQPTPTFQFQLITYNHEK